MVIVVKKLKSTPYSGIAIWPFIFVQDKEDQILINHEKIHMRQANEMLVLPFYLWYGIEFIFRFIQYGNWEFAYENISLEREAYKNQYNYNYLDNRKFWSFVKFI